MNPSLRACSASHALSRTAAFLALLLVPGIMACGNPDSEEASSTPAAADTLNTIADVLAGDDRFSTLATAIDTTDLTASLRSEGPYTVFAPTNAAFDQLPEGTVEALLQPENRDRLTAILTYHVVEGTATATDVQAMDSLSTLAGRALAVRTSNGTVVVGEAAVVEPNLEASNGVIHVIDAVLRPPADEAMM